MSSRAATATEPQSLQSPRALGNPKHEEAVQWLERVPFVFRTLHTREQQDNVLEAARSVMRPEVSPSAASSASAFLENAATQLMGSFTSPKEAELLMEARRLKEEEKNKERMAKLRKEKEAVLRCRVVLIGGSGVGKSSLKACVVQTDVIRTLPDMVPSTSTGSSFYYYNSSKGDKLEMNLVDGGPLEPSTGNLAHYMISDSVAILVVNLSYVKQRNQRGKPSAGSGSAGEGTVFLHPKDQEAIFNYLHALAASAPGSSVIVVGTHLDLLSDRSPAAVEQVLKYLNEIVSKEIRHMHDALDDTENGCLRLSACFAVSCQTRFCVSENRFNGPTTIAQLWEFVCELVLKQAKYADSIGRPFGVGVLLTPHYALVQQLLHRIKNELLQVMVDRLVFEKALYALGVYRRVDRSAVLQALVDSGEALILPGLDGDSCRPESILFFPHLLSRTAAITVLHNLWLSYPISHRGKLLPGLDIAACDTADPKRMLNEGYPGPRLLVELSRCLTSIRRNPDERVELYVSLLLHSDFLFVHGGSLEETQYVDPDDEAFLEGKPQPPTFVIPSMISRTFPESSLKFLQQTIENSSVISMARRVVFAIPVPGLFHCLQCRLGKLLVHSHSISKDGAWFRVRSSYSGEGRPEDDTRVLLLERRCATDRQDPFLDVIILTPMNTVDPIHTLLNAAALIHETMLELVQDKFRGAKPVVFPSRPDIFLPSIVEEMERLEALHREPTTEEWSVVYQGAADAPFEVRHLDSVFKMQQTKGN